MLDSENLKKLFYYCLKRTGNRETAEDLSSDISLEILTMLNRGYKPENFYAWMWTVARAKYAAWVKTKKTRYENVIIGDIANIDIISDNIDDNIETKFVKEEEMRLLRRELSIMSKEYREITVAYYIENRKIADIAKNVNMPEGTIKRKLSESRKYLKEGINMVRTYGTRSYSPENVYFHYVKSGTPDECSCPACSQFSLARNINENVPDNLFSKLAKNILLETYINPCSTEELSVSLGVAAPYLEEELDKLAEGLFLAKTKDNKYETDFIILDKETQKDIINKTIETADKICAELFVFSGIDMGIPTFLETMSTVARNAYKSGFTKKYIKEWLEKSDAEHNLSGREEYCKSEEYLVIEEAFKEGLIKWKADYPGNKTTAGLISSEEAIWFYLFKKIRDIIVTVEMDKQISAGSPKKFKDGWSITGFEEYTENELLKYHFGMDWETDKEHNQHWFKFYFNDSSRTKLTLRDFELITDILNNGKKFSDLSENEKEMVQELVRKQLAVTEDDIVKTTFPILFMNGLQDLGKLVDHEKYPEKAKKFDEGMVAMIQASAEKCNTAIFGLYEHNLSVIKRNLPERLEEQAKFCARDMLSYLNNAVLKIATENNYLIPTDKPVGIGAYVVN